MEPKKNDLVPVQRVSMDNFQSALLGQLYNSNGCTDSNHMFNGGCIFVDRVSGYIQVWHQFTISENKTVKDMLLYKHYASNYGVCIQAYHDDNGVFTPKDFMY